MDTISKEQSKTLPSVSFLWPADRNKSYGTQKLSSQAVKDLDVATMVEHLCSDVGQPAFVRSILLQLCTDPRTIRYRQQILQDVLNLSGFADRVKELLPEFASIRQFRRIQETGDLLQEVCGRLGELESYIDCVGALSAALSETGDELRSEGLQRLKEMVTRIETDPTFRRLSDELPGLFGEIRSATSITVGINLDRNLRQCEATLLSVNTKKFSGPASGLFHVLFGGDRAKVNQGIAPLHSMQKRAGRGGAAGLPMCVPHIAEMHEKACRIEEVYDLNLAMRFNELDGYGRQNGEDRSSQKVVTNRVDFESLGRIFILTGPNRGGKTTYMKAVGTAQILARAGLYVPGREATLSAVDGIYTHFPAEERPEIDAGRLGEEAQRLSAIFTVATPQSLILLNESLANTNPAESLHLCRDMVRALLILGARGIFSTHQHALAEEVESLNAEMHTENRAVSLVSLTEEDATVKRTYRIQPRRLTGLSHEKEIARRYGISFEQLREKLRNRGILTKDES